MPAAFTTVSWQAPPLVGFCYQTTLPDNLNPVFVDIYFDTREGANYLWNTSYRLRMRFQNSADIPGLRPLRVEYQSHFDQTPFVDGFSARTESRINLGPQPIATATNLDRFIQNAQSGMVDSS